MDEYEVTRIINKLLSYDEQIARIREASAVMIESLETEKEFQNREYLPLLRSWFELNQPRKGKSIKTIAGTIGFRTVKGGIRIVDEDVFVSWANDDNYRHLLTEKIVIKPNRDQTKIWVQSTGEIPPGVEIREDEERFYVSPPRAAAEPEF